MQSGLCWLSRRHDRVVLLTRRGVAWRGGGLLDAAALALARNAFQLAR